MQGTVFNIQKFCTSDGPGIRTTVFLKGCPMRCMWCHNPESHSFECETMKDGENSELCGKKISAQEVIEEVLKDKIFYENSGGGITISGGEPLTQFEFSYNLLSLAKQNGLHTCIETCGFLKTEELIKISELVDIFLFDWKLTDGTLHQKYTGKSNRLILENLKELNKANKTIILRCPIIPTVNDTDEHFLGIANLANTLKNIIKIEIEPYHSLGNHKYKKLGKTLVKEFSEPCNRQVSEWIEKIKAYTETEVCKA